jgi:ribbon-helix-helix CopG family protein
MRKTSVYLTDDEAEGLRRVAVREGRPQAELIREGIRRVIAEGESRPRDFRSLGMGRGGGRPYEPWPATDLHRKVMGTKSWP